MKLRMNREDHFGRVNMSADSTGVTMQRFWLKNVEGLETL
jgi:hypothetical protein